MNKNNLIAFFVMAVSAVFISYVSIKSFMSHTDITPQYASHDNYASNDTMDTDTIDVMEILDVKYPYKVSERGEQFIKEHEKLKLKRYLIKGERYYTIGWGHQMRERDIPHEIDIQYAEMLFDKDMNKVNAAVNRLVRELPDDFEITQHMVDGLGSLVFNCGESGIRNSDFFTRLKRCRFDNDGNINMKDWVYTVETIKYTKVFMNGHKTRRMNEYNLIKNGVYDI